MLYDDIEDHEETTPESLRRAYEDALVDVVEDVGAATAAAESGVDRERIDALLEGDHEEVTVEEAAAILALSEEWPDAEAIRLEVRDNLMLQMSSAVVDVDAVASDAGTGLEAREIQQKIEGRQPMTLAEYARIYHYVAGENPY